VENEKYKKYKEAPIFIVYSGGGQDESRASRYNKGLTEAKVLQEFALAKNGLMIVVDKLQTGYDEPKLHTLFLDKEIVGINAIQTISRVNRTMKHKNECKIIDFSYKNINVENIKKAFEHFSDVVVSDFDPFGELKMLNILFEEVRQSEVCQNYFKLFVEIWTQKERKVEKFFELEDSFARHIRGNSKRSKKLKVKINDYFRILNLIEYVIDFDKKFVEVMFLEFWKRYNNIYNNINKPEEEKDDVEIYFDNKIGIVEPPDVETGKKKKKEKVGSGKKHKYNILDLIEKKNEENKIIGELIEDFEKKIDKFFKFIPEQEIGQNLIAKMDDVGTKFNEDEVLEDFEKVYRKFIRLNKKDLGEFFRKETEDILDKLYEDFEENLKTKDLKKI